MIPDNVLIELIREVSRNTRRIDDLPRPEVGSGGSGPADAEYLVNAASADLTNEIVVAAASGYIIRGHDPGAGVTWEAYDASTDGQILIGDGTDINSVAITGDINITNAGVTELRLYDTGADHYLTLTYNEDATANRNLNLDLNDGDRNLTLEGDLTVESASLINQDLTTDASPTFAGLTLNGNESITSGNEQRFYDADDSNYVGFEAPALTANQIWKLPTADGLANQALVTDAAGNLSWATVSNLTGLGTDNRITRWDGPDTLQDSLVQIDDSGNIEFVNGGLYIGRNGDVRIKFDSANGYIDTILSDDGGSDRFRIVDSATAEKAYIDSNGNGQFDGDVTAANFYGADGTEFGITGNELLTVNAAGNFTFSGVSSVVVPDGAWVGADSDCAWLFDSTNGDVSTQDLVAINLTAPLAQLHVRGESNDIEVLRVDVPGSSGVVQGKGYIGLHHFTASNTNPSVAIGVEEDGVGSYNASLVFQTRNSGADTAPTTRITIKPDGDVDIESGNLSFVTTKGIVHADDPGAGSYLRSDGTRYIPAVIQSGDLPAHASTHESGGGDQVDHDALLNFVANEHIDHTSVTLTAGDGLTGGGDISANRTFDLNTPGTLTAATGNSAAGNHTHAITTTSDGTADTDTILQTNASGQIALEDLFLADDSVVGVSGDSYIIFDSSEDKLELYTNNVLRAVFGPNISFDTQLQMDGNRIVFDADDDTGFIANSDDVLDVVIAAATDFDFQANEFNVLSGSHITMADDTWIGLGAAAERIVFDAAGNVDILDAVLLINATSYISNSPLVIIGGSRSPAANSHAFVDEATITGAAGSGHNAFDAYATYDGSNNYDHVAGFQARPDYESTGTANRVTGFQSLPVLNAACGTVTRVTHFEARDYRGGGTATNQYGLYVEELASATNNYGVHFLNTPNGGSISSAAGVDIGIMPGGDVGLGTLLPSNKFHVYDASSSIAIKVESDGGNANVIMDAATGNDAQLLFYNNGAFKWRIANDGDDSHKLKIIGDGGPGTDDFFEFDQSGDVTALTGSYYGVDGVEFGISGNELLTVNAAGTFAFSGISGVTVEDDDYIGIGAAAGRFIFDSTPTPDEIRVADGNLDLNGNDLILDSDGDSYIHASADDTIQYVISGAPDFSMTANSLNVLSGSDIDMADGTSITGGAGEPTIEFDSTNDHLEITNADVIIGGTTPQGALDVAWGGQTIISGADLDASTRTDSTTKHSRFGLYHYTNAEEPVGIVYATSSITDNVLFIGGGTSRLNAATIIDFFTAPNTTTTTGARRARIFSNGDMSIGTTSNSGQLHVDQSSATGAQPTLFLDQGDTSEQCIEFSSDAADRDINLWTVNVTGTPTAKWDESEDAFMVNKSWYINSGANSDMSIGITIDQKGNDDQIFALRDSTDVAHGITDLTPTDIYGSFEKAVASGGMEINGISGNSVAEGVTILAISQSESTADDSGADGAIKLTGAKKSGTNVAGLSNNANIVAMTNDNTTTHVFKGNGDIYIAGSVTENDWDDYDDLALLHGLRAEITPSLREKFGQWISYARPILEKTKVVSYEDNGRFMMSQKGLHMLVIDTVRVLFERFIQAEKKSQEEFAQLERRILQLEGGVS